MKRAEAQALADELYKKGAIRVHATDVSGFANNKAASFSASILVIELPNDASARKALFSEFNQMQAPRGYKEARTSARNTSASTHFPLETSLMPFARRPRARMTMRNEWAGTPVAAGSPPYREMPSQPTPSAAAGSGTICSTLTPPSERILSSDCADSRIGSPVSFIFRPRRAAPWDNTARCFPLP